MPIWAYIGAGGLIAGILSGWTLRDWKADSDQIAAIQKADKLQARLEQVQAEHATKFEQFAADNRVAVSQDRSTIERIYKNVPVPADCAVPAAAVGVLNNARDRANAATTGQPSATVRTAAEPAGTADRSGSGKVGN